MTYVLTLISNENDKHVTNEIKQKYTDIIQPTNTKWLAENIALDIYFDHDIEVIKNKTINLLKNEKIDYAFQKKNLRSKKLLVADMDSTIIQCECIDELADYIGIKDKVSKITEAAMRGDIDFEGALKERVMLLKDMPVSQLVEVFEKRVKLTPGARTLVQTMNKNGAETVLVSGGFTFFTGKVAELTGFKVNRGNILMNDGEKLTGEVGSPIVDSDTKINSLREFQNKLNIKNDEIIAVGDGANDIPMLEGAGMGVGYHPFPKAGEAANVVINYGDLTALLYLQGFTQSDFVIS